MTVTAASDIVIVGTDAALQAAGLVIEHVETVDAALETDASVYVVGPDVSDPAVLAASLHARRPYAEILVLAPLGAIDDLRHALQLAPGLGGRVRCLNIDDPELAESVHEAAQRVSRRRGHAATLETIHQAGIPARPDSGPLLNYLEQLMDLIPVGVLGLDGAGRIATWNQAAQQILSIPAGQLQGSHLAGLFDTGDLAGIDAVLHGGNRGPSTAHVQVGSADETRHVEIVAARVNAPNGQPGSLVMVRDVTAEVAEREAQQELERLRVLMESAGAAAHEINNPLAGLMGSLELLLDSDSDKERSELANTAFGEAERIRDVVARMARIRAYATRPYLDTQIIDLHRAAPDDPET